MLANGGRKKQFAIRTFAISNDDDDESGDLCEK
jgi:hypothetical protein